MSVPKSEPSCNWPNECKTSCGRFVPGRDEEQRLADSCFMCSHSRDCHETSDEAEAAFKKGVQNARREIRGEIATRLSEYRWIRDDEGRKEPHLGEVECVEILELIDSTIARESEKGKS